MDERYKFDPEIDLPRMNFAKNKSMYVAMALISKTQNQVVELTHENKKWAAKTAMKIRQTPPEWWPTGEWSVVGRVRSLGGEKSTLFVQYLGDSGNDWIRFKTADFGGRPKRRGLQMGQAPKLTWNYKVHERPAYVDALWERDDLPVLGQEVTYPDGP